MNINFIVNDYVIAWNILYQASVSSVIHTHKMKLWNTYQQQYTELSKDNIKILKDGNDFIPDDDTIYNLVFKEDYFDVIKKETEKHRLFLMKAFDHNKKKLDSLLKDILRFEYDKNFDVFVVHPLFDSVCYIKKANKNALMWGNHTDTEDDINTLINIIHFIFKRKFEDYDKDNSDIVDTVLELAIKNELYTLLTGKSKYLDGNNKLKPLKRKLYPYWLMYLGADKEDFVKYMRRDSIAFDIDCYTEETKLAKVDLYGFIDFCIKNFKIISKKIDVNDIADMEII